MAQLKSHRHIELVLNGHRFTGWSDDDPPYEFEYEDSIETKTGQDGGLYGSSKPNFGATLTFKLSPTSPSCQWAMQQEQLRKNSVKDNTVLRVYSGTFSDPVQGVSWRLEGGFIMKFPAINIANQTYEGSVMFEELIANVDGGRFSSPLASDSRASAVREDLISPF